MLARNHSHPPGATHGPLDFSDTVRTQIEAAPHSADRPITKWLQWILAMLAKKVSLNSVLFRFYSPALFVRSDLESVHTHQYVSAVSYSKLGGLILPP